MANIHVVFQEKRDAKKIVAIIENKTAKKLRKIRFQNGDI